MEYCVDCGKWIESIVEEHQNLDTGEVMRWRCCPLCDGEDIKDYPEDRDELRSEDKK